jgi:hypothetical protein
MSRVTLLCETSSPILKRRASLALHASPDRQTGERILDTLRMSAYLPWVQPAQQMQRSQKTNKRDPNKKKKKKRI